MKKVLFASSLLLVTFIAFQLDASQVNAASFEVMSNPYFPPVALPS
ncbi:hypothetical protein [Alkalicoccobacillus gibsonii]